MAEPDWSQYEALVEKRWDYYCPRFERFARGGWLSWNWAAFFGTLAWLRYRKLYLWTWIYFFLSTPLLFAVLTLLAAGDGCERALDPVPGSVLGMVVVALMSLGWIVPPLFANRLYYAHVRSLVAEPAARTGTSTGGYAGALALQAFFIVGSVMSAASYANYAYRSMVSEGVSLAAGAKTPLTEYLEDKKRLPAKIQEVAGNTSGKYVERMVLESNGAIRAIFGDKGRKLSGRSVTMVPLIKDGRVVEWTCRSDDLPNQCLPASCRR